MRKICILAIFLCLAATGLQAGGYQVSLHGNKQIGMGLIGTSLSMDASSAFYNPGGLAMMPGKFSVLAGGSGIFASTAFQMPYPSLIQASTNNSPGTPFYFYAGYKITPKLAAGIAINTPYGNSLKWEDEWAGRFLIQEISLQAITIQPTLSYQIAPYLSVGAGLVYTMGAVSLSRALPVQDENQEGRLLIEGSTTNIGFNAGMLFSGQNGLQVGVSYRSRVDMDVDDGKAFFTVPASLQGNFPPENRVGTSLPLPANLDLGLSYQLNSKLLLGVALNYVFWEAYETLDFTFETNTLSLTDSQSPRYYSNTLIFRAGGHYELNEKWTVRAGAYYDPSPVDPDFFSPETPSLNNLALTSGLSFSAGRFGVDLSLLYIMGLEADRHYVPENFGGTYKSRAIIPGLGISYGF